MMGSSYEDHSFELMDYLVDDVGKNRTAKRMVFHSQNDDTKMGTTVQSILK